MTEEQEDRLLALYAEHRRLFAAARVLVARQNGLSIEHMTEGDWDWVHETIGNLRAKILSQPDDWEPKTEIDLLVKGMHQVGCSIQDAQMGRVVPMPERALCATTSSR